MKKHILAIDPGTEKSALILWDYKKKEPTKLLLTYNQDILEYLLYANSLLDQLPIILVIEMIACYGMAVGRSVFETCLWIGRFIQIWEAKHDLIYRRDIKLHLCNSVKAKDTNIRQALIDKFGETGTKKNPGKLYGIKKDLWSALAVATYYDETRNF